MRFRVLLVSSIVMALNKSLSKRSIKRLVKNNFCSSTTLTIFLTMMILQALLYLTRNPVHKRVVELRDGLNDASDHCVIIPTEIELKLCCQRGAYRKMILAKCDVYFRDDISVLWHNLEVILLNEMIAILESHSRNPEQFTSAGVVLANLELSSDLLVTLHPRCHNATLLLKKDHMSAMDTRALTSVICRIASGNWERSYNKQIYDIPVIETDILIPIYIMAVSSKSLDYEIITHAEKYNGDTFRHITPPCVKQEQPTAFDNLCDVYPSIATMPRRTHKHFISNVRDSDATDLKTGVTLITQLMFNRIDNLERLLQSWKGPSQVALYLTDEELVSFNDAYQQSDILKQANATYHVIFKRHVFYPINYVRNVAIRETKTPFYVMIDVDFAAQPTLYQDIIRYIRKLKPNEKKVFVIPVFETPYKHYSLPVIKEQLVKDLDANLLIPYHQVPGSWTKGHERTNYDKWRISRDIYEVQWEFGYEPYVVVPTSEFLYDEILVERMRDKLAYTANIKINGCARIMYEKRIQELTRKHQQEQKQQEQHL
ncbi:hypothetical protein LSH36_189g06082 [Paralvinella palmiformis]|uniref:Uncharacterized protein n=1 Tax=Paralvinella palmiformis TaxID=53620 RepID=A0AAD9JQW8_9ANNE|nr:hypothetical protein LSH36_189g06082 [Paralvinella palmiformis]